MGGPLGKGERDKSRRREVGKLKINMSEKATRNYILLAIHKNKHKQRIMLIIQL